MLWGPVVGDAGTGTGGCPGKHCSPYPIRLLRGTIRLCRKQEYFLCLRENFILWFILAWD